MRQRTKTKGLVSHATPNGKAKLSEREILYKKFNNGDITKEELRKYVNFLTIEKKVKTIETTVTIKFGGKTMVLTIEEYNKYYKPAYSNILVINFTYILLLNIIHYENNIYKIL